MELAPYILRSSDIVRVTNNNKNPNPSPKKPLSRNQKIIAIAIIIGGSLFLINEIAWRVDQDAEIDERTRELCRKLKNINPDDFEPGELCKNYP